MQRFLVLRTTLILFFPPQLVCALLMLVPGPQLHTSAAGTAVASTAAARPQVCLLLVQPEARHLSPWAADPYPGFVLRTLVGFPDVLFLRLVDAGENTGDGFVNSSVPGELGSGPPVTLLRRNWTAPPSSLPAVEAAPPSSCQEGLEPSS